MAQQCFFCFQYSDVLSFLCALFFGEKIKTQCNFNKGFFLAKVTQGRQILRKKDLKSPDLDNRFQ
jgi:hypothetical protein